MVTWVCGGEQASAGLAHCWRRGLRGPLLHFERSILERPRPTSSSSSSRSLPLQSPSSSLPLSAPLELVCSQPLACLS